MNNGPRWLLTHPTVEPGRGNGLGVAGRMERSMGMKEEATKERKKRQCTGR